jgi:hypothetical protein
MQEHAPRREVLRQFAALLAGWRSDAALAAGIDSLETPACDDGGATTEEADAGGCVSTAGAMVAVGRGAGETGATAGVKGRAGSVTAFSWDNAEWNDVARTRSVNAEATAAAFFASKNAIGTFI